MDLTQKERTLRNRYRHKGGTEIASESSSDKNKMAASLDLRVSEIQRDKEKM